MTGPVSLKLADWRYVEVHTDPSSFLGEGTFGRVYVGVRKANAGRRRKWPEGPIAVKFPKRTQMNDQEKNSFLSEIDIMSQVSHPACLNLFAWTWDTVAGQFGIATDIMPYSLDKIIEQDSRGIAPPAWTPTRRSCVALAIAAGMNHIHSRNIIHRDLKLANVLLDEQYLPHIADFGLSKLISLENQMEMTTRIGTPIYMAPELYREPEIEGEPQYTGKVDVYAYGLLLFGLYTTQKPFSNYKSPFTLQQAVIKGVRPTIPDEVPANVKGLIEACWAGNPDDRPSFEGLLRDPDQFLLEAEGEAAFREFTSNLLVEGKMVLSEKTTAWKKAISGRMD
jgi:serine/threonine protein kinase